MKKKLLIATMIFALVMALVGGATFALFTGSDSNEVKTFSAGTVEINIQRNDDPVPGPMFYTTLEEGMGSDTQNGNRAPKFPTGEWAPGDKHVRGMTVLNTGSLTVKLDRIGAKITGDTDFLNDAAAVKEFKDNLMVKVEAKISEDQYKLMCNEKPLSAFLAPGGVEADLFKPVIAGREGNNITTQHLRWTCTLSTNAGDPLQGKKPVVSFYLTAEQADNN